MLHLQFVRLRALELIPLTGSIFPRSLTQQKHEEYNFQGDEQQKSHPCEGHGLLRIEAHGVQHENEENNGGQTENKNSGHCAHE